LNAYRIDSLIVEKRKVVMSLRVEEEFYPRMVGYLLRYILNPIPSDTTEIIVMTDSIPILRKRNAIEKAVKQTLSHMLPSEIRYQIFHHAAKSSPSLQVADYCNWAIFRKWEKGDIRSYEIIRTAIRSEFEIFQKGEHYYY